MRTFVASLREMSGVPPRSRAVPSTAPGKELAQVAPLGPRATERVPTSRMLAWMSSQEPHVLDDDQRTMLVRLCELSPTIKMALELGQAFAAMARNRRADELDGWLERAEKSEIVALGSVARGIRDDLAAVRAGLSMCWSNGRTEGSVNRLKCVKRQMYGRGKLDLLRLRLIAA